MAIERTFEKKGYPLVIYHSYGKRTIDIDELAIKKT